MRWLLALFLFVAPAFCSACETGDVNDNTTAATALRQFFDPIEAQEIAKAQKIYQAMREELVTINAALWDVHRTEIKFLILDSLIDEIREVTEVVKCTIVRDLSEAELFIFLKVADGAAPNVSDADHEAITAVLNRLQGSGMRLQKRVHRHVAMVVMPRLREMGFYPESNPLMIPQGG